MTRGFPALAFIGRGSMAVIQGYTSLLPIWARPMPLSIAVNSQRYMEMATALAVPVGPAPISVKELPRQIPAPTSDSAAPSVAQLCSRIRGGLPPRALRRVREFIEANLAENISIQELGAIAGLSMYHFARAFKQSVGMPPHAYLVQRRVQRVQDLLTATDLPLSEIALAAGFADQSHCARRFRQHIGVTPGSYRWSMR